MVRRDISKREGIIDMTKSKEEIRDIALRLWGKQGNPIHYIIKSAGDVRIVEKKHWWE